MYIYIYILYNRGFRAAVMFEVLDLVLFVTTGQPGTDEPRMKLLRSAVTILAV